MKGCVLGLALCAAASLAPLAFAGEATSSRVDVTLATPAPVPGTLDFQLAALEAAQVATQSPVVSPAPFANSGSVGVARRVIDAAGAFDGYVRRATGMEAFRSGPAVLAGVDVGAGYEARQLQAGAIAYGALAAMQDTLFVDAVRASAPTDRDREALAARLADSPASVLRLPGSHAAASRIAELVGERGTALIEAGEGLHRASYAVQKEAWSKAPITKVQERLDEVKARSATPEILDAQETRALMTHLVALRAGALQSRAGGDYRPTPATAQALALAALAVLGYAGEDHAATLDRLLTTGRGEDCLKLAKLNLYQCLAVAGPHYEDMFCLGRHALADTGQCVVFTAGSSGPPAATAPPLQAAVLQTPVPSTVLAAAPSPPPPVSIAVPVALAAVDGPERARAFAPAPGMPETSELSAGQVVALAFASGAPVVLARDDGQPRFREVGRTPRLDENEDEGAHSAYSRALDPDRSRAPPRGYARSEPDSAPRGEAYGSYVGGPWDGYRPAARRRSDGGYSYRDAYAQPADAPVSPPRWSSAADDEDDASYDLPQPR